MCVCVGGGGGQGELGGSRNRGGYGEKWDAFCLP